MRKKGTVDEARAAVPQRSAKAVAMPGQGAKVMREGDPPPRLPEESEKDYALLVAWWQKGEAMSSRALARELGIPQPRLSRARKKWQWNARIQAALEETPEVKQGWAARREALREEEWELHRECLAAGREALRQWQDSGEVAGLGEVVKLLEFAARLARLAAGVPEAHLAVTGEDGEPIRLQFEAALAQAYGPVVDVAAEVVEGKEERASNDIGNGTAPELRKPAAAVAGGAEGGDSVRGTKGGGLRGDAGASSRGGEVHPGQGSEGGAE